jgi:hypothetical protein
MPQEIVQAFENFFGQHGRYYSEFYVGIATDPVDRLTKGHGVSQSIPHIYWNSPLHTNVVRQIEDLFLKKGAKGGPGGGDNSTCFIYAYKITPNTRQ